MLTTEERLKQIRRNIENGYYQTAEETDRPLPQRSAELDKRINQALNMQLPTTQNIEAAKAFIPVLNKTLFRLRYHTWFNLLVDIFRWIGRRGNDLRSWAEARADLWSRIA